MRSFYFFLLQAQAGLEAGFVMKAGLLVIILCGFIIYLTILHRHKKNRMHEEKLLQQEQFNQQLLQSRIEVQEATFAALSAELHDNVGQLISSAMMFVNMAERELTDVPANLRSAVVTLDKATIELRTLSKSLRKDWLEKFDIWENLHQEISSFNNNGNFYVKTEMDELPLLTPEQQFILFRIMQEGIQNVLRHSNASLLVISIREQQGAAVIVLKDNGRGFNIKSKTNGIGIQNMQLRTRALGGSITWQSGSAGTHIHISIPIKSEG